MKALKRKDSTKENPVWGKVVSKPYIRVDPTNTPTLYENTQTKRGILNAIIISSDHRQAMNEYELVTVELKIK